MDKPHPLDIAYDEWFNSPIIPAPKDHLLSIVLSHAKRLTGDEDAAQDAALYIFQNLYSFTRRKANSFSCWVYSICRRRRLESYRVRHHDQFEDDNYVPVDDSYRDYSLVPEPLLPIVAALMDGKTIDELAAEAEIASASYRKKIMRQLVQ